MKKFLIYLVVILVAVSVGFTVFYLVRDNESISITTSSIYMREGDVIDDLEIIYENRKSFSDYEVFSSNDNIAKYDKEKGTLTAVSGGIATITFRTSNVKFRNLSCQVYVGDGSITSPYYIQTAAELREIGQTSKVGDENVVKYGLDKCYKLVNNINLNEGHAETGYWIPIGTGSGVGFTGNFDGNGYTISNITVNKQEYIAAVEGIEGFEDPITNARTFVNAGLFGKIGPNGRVCNLKLENVSISGSYSESGNKGNVGIVAGENYGTIERVEVISGNIDVTNTLNVGGIAGAIISSEASVEVENETGEIEKGVVRYTARVDRCIANVNLGISKDYADGPITGIANTVGGLVGTSEGGIIIYSYSKGDVFLNEQTTNYGGIVGFNQFKRFEQKDENYMYDYTGGHVKDTYSLMRLRKINNVNANANIGGIIGYNQDGEPLDSTINGVESSGNINKIVGNYYLNTNLNYVEEDLVVNPDEPASAEPTNYVGCGKFVIDDKPQTYADEKYKILGKSESELKLQSTYQSHEENYYISGDDENYVSAPVIISWKFDTVWQFVENVNDGYPTLNFANIEVSDDLYDITDGTTIKNASELQNMKLDGKYIIINDIYFTDDMVWKPIGTINRPFIGSLSAGAYMEGGVKKYYKIYNIKTSQSRNLDEINKEELEYAGLFGVTNGTNGGKIENITLVNPLFANARVVGGIVASNGYIDNVKGVETTFKGSTIDNCQIVGGTLRAYEKVGGIAGDNFGTIKASAIADQKDDDYNIVKNTKIILYAKNSGYAGGVVAYNNGSISGSRLTETSYVKAQSGTSNNFAVYVGGIAGTNNGTITNCATTSTSGVIIEGLKGNVGGVAGVNTNTITNCLVKTNINAPTSNDQVYAGGVVGSTIENSFITKVLIKETSIRGYNAGGIAGLVNYSTANNYKYNLTVDKNYNYTLTNNDVDTISLVAVEDSTAVEGHLAGGFAAIIDNGIIRNCYTQATLRGVDKNSIKAGFAPYLNLNPTTKAVGIIINCYNTCAFASGNGSNYSVSQKEILQNPVFDFGLDSLKRNAGYCFDYAYLKQDGVTNPTNKDIIWNLFDQDKSGTDMGSLIGRSPTHLTDRHFDQTYWKFNDSALPTLKDVENMEDSLATIFERVYKLTFPENVQVSKNGTSVSSGSKVNKGDVLIITYTETEKYSKTKFTVNGVEFENGGKFVVGERNVEIVYEEKLTHYDVEIVAPENGTVSVGADYIKEGTEVTINIVPNENFIVDTVKVTKENGDNVEITADYKFTMPSEKVKIEVTFKQTYGVTIPENVELLKGEDAILNGSRLLAGDEVTINVTPDEGFVLDTLTIKTVSGGEVELKDNKFVMPSEDVVVEVTFKRYGTVTKAENVKLKVDGVEVAEGNKILEGKTIVLEITPETNYVVDLITVTKTSGETVEFNVAEYSFVMPNEDVTINVTYKPTYSLTISNLIEVYKNDVKLTSSDRVVEGDVLTIKFVPSEGYRITSATINGVPYADGASYNVGKEDIVILANESKEFMVSVSNEIANGVISLDKVKAIKDEQVTLTIVPSENYELVKLYYVVNGDETLTQHEITGTSFVMPEADITIYAEFGLIE